MRILRLLPVFLVVAAGLFAQNADYAQKKKTKLAAPSPFEAVIAGQSTQKLVYQDEYVVAFEDRRPQAPVHFLVVPRKRIASLNEATEADALMLGHLLLAAQKIARERGIAETGYRIAINTNEAAGQTVFHLHLHLLGGMDLGPMLPQTFQRPNPEAAKAP
jgi:histidine triad (HIT) family protein